MTKEDMPKRPKYAYEYDIVAHPVKELGLGVRHLQAILMFLCVLLALCIRAMMSIAIVAMTSHTSSSDSIKFYAWDKRVQNLVLSSFFLGYLALQVPGGILATRLGGKRLLGAALGINGLLCLAVPWAVSLGEWKALLVVRVTQGLAQGWVFPALNTLLGKWAPLNERSRITNLVYAGAPLGTVLAMPVSGYLSASTFGWPSVFYLFGTLGTLVSIFWFYWGADSPNQHKSISEEERKYIENSLGKYEEKEEAIADAARKMATPWRAMFTSVPLMAICVSHTGMVYGFITLLLETPIYLKEVHGIDVKQSGVLTSLPYLAMWLVGSSSAFIADFAVNKKILSLTDVRKVSNTIANVCPAVSLIILCMVPPHQTALAIVIIITTVGFTGAINTGVVINHMDLSPNFAGIMFGLTNMVANIFGLIAPNIVGFIVTDSTDPSQWNLVFYIVAAVYFSTNLIYLVFGTAEKQPWDDPIYEDEEVA